MLLFHNKFILFKEVNIIKFKSPSKKTIKKTLPWILIFLLINSFLFFTQYKKYTSNAPENVIEARKYFATASMFNIYYTFLVKTMRIDFRHAILFPLKIPKDYFYNIGIEKLPKKSSERAIWFDTFEAKSYTYSINARYGSLRKTQGEKFSKKFMRDLYKNIQVLSLNEFTATDIVNHEDVLTTYIELVTIFTSEAHMNPDKGYIYNTENLNKFRSDAELYKKFINIHNWNKTFISNYRKAHANDFSNVLNTERGWYSPVRNYYSTLLSISSFILLYKTNNNLFIYNEDKKYLKDIEESKIQLINLLKNYPKYSHQLKTLEKKIKYLEIKY